MPLYEYECDAAGHRFEVIQKFSDPPVEKCPQCGSTVHKLMSSPAIQFKGSGWYITDYAKKDSTSAGRAGGSKDSSSNTESSSTQSHSSESKSGESKSSGSKADSKPAAAPTKAD